MSGKTTLKARAIAFYLPQYYPIPENDRFWGKGFTEWTNVTKARPLFKGHWQPHLPSDLGFYDLRVPEVREQQAEFARYAGIEGFCYWHYWFGNGKRVLDRVFKEVLATKKPDLPFCLAWANESWTGRWHGLDSEVIFEQTYPGLDDYKAHFYTLLPAFEDDRYIEVDGKKLFVIYRPDKIPDLCVFLEYWNDLAQKNGMKGFFFVSANILFDHSQCNAMNAVFPRDLSEVVELVSNRDRGGLINQLKKFSGGLGRWAPGLYGLPLRCSYSEFVDAWSSRMIKDNTFPCVIPNWDNTPRCGRRGVVLLNSTPELFSKLVAAELNKIINRPLDRRILFIKSWNEWAEGNYLEPDQKYGNQYLLALRELLVDVPD